MKKLFIFLFATILLSCAKSDLTSEATPAKLTQTELSVVEQCEKHLDDVFPKTRSMGERIATVQTTYRAVKSPDGVATRSATNEEWIPLHIVNFSYENGSDAGFVVMTDDERVDEQIFVYNNEGNWSADNLGEFGNIFFDYLDGYLEHSVAQSRIEERPLCRKIKEIVKRERTEHECRIGTVWGQDYPYNMLTPSCSNLFCNEKEIPTGCVATAIAQIMAYHEKPKVASASNPLGITTQVTYDWSVMKALPQAYQLPDEYQYLIAHLMRAVGTRANIKYRCDKHDGSVASIDDAKACLESFGYTNVHKSNFEPYLIEGSINNNRPVYMRGEDENGDKNGHAWVIEGYKHFYDHVRIGEHCEGSPDPVLEDNITSIYDFYFNLGWDDPTVNAYYRFNIFHEDVLHQNRPFRYDIKTLTGMY